MDNNKKIYEYRDSSGVEHSIELDSSKFTLAQKDKSIHDQKFKTKPTTFFKDALKRFAKNKSSVAGAVILGVLLVASVVIPVIDRSDLNKPRPEQSFLEPKLFNAGTGFWDGTKRLTDIPCDPKTETVDKETGKVFAYPDLKIYPTNAISNLSERRIGYVYNATTFAKGGFINLINDNGSFTGNEYEDLKREASTLVGKAYTFKNDKEYSLKVNVFDEKVENYSIAKYEISLEYSVALQKEQTEKDRITKELILKPYNDNSMLKEETIENPVDKEKPYKVNVFETKNILEGFKTVNEEEKPDFELPMTLKISVFPEENSKSSILLHSLKVTSTDEGFMKKDLFSFADANEMLLRTSDADNYWTYDGIRTLYKGAAAVCDFTFDTYEAVYGEKTETVEQVKIEEYIKKGWLDEGITAEYKNMRRATNPDEIFQKYVKDADHLPIVKVNKVTQNTFGNKTSYKFESVVSGYKLLGYTSMPRFLAGTDKQGYNLLKQVFVGLRNSLGLGIVTFLICFSFGLIFGAICGYFGGFIDIALQRFVDVLSGIPRIVIMTLVVLQAESLAEQAGNPGAGNNFGVFLFAMCLTGWIGTSSLTRTQFYRFRDREYTLASRTLGASSPRLIFRHILPNAMGTIITSSVLMIPSVIFTEATISYLGLGFKNMVSLGVTLSQNQTYLLTYPHLILFPSVIMALIMISFNLFGNGLRDAFNPSLKGSE